MLEYFHRDKTLPEWQARPYRIGKVATGRTVLVAGATTKAGRKICRAIIDRGDKLIVLVQDRKQAWNVYGPHAMIITDIKVLSHGTVIDEVLNFSEKNYLKKSKRRDTSSASLVSWTAAFL